jgi:hypothetical protein
MVKDKDATDKTQKEIQEEIAKALGHSGEQLESVLAELRKLEKILEKTLDNEEYNNLVDQYNSLVKTARVRREMLVIHREAIGVRKHSFIDTFYPIPDKKRKRKDP